jgi:multiple sugar transport system permease protein/raffinose/stachyose/melibiose transport system permease protein
MRAEAIPQGQRKWNRQNIGLFFVLPSLVIYVIFFLYPFFSSIYLSLTDWDGVQPVMNFVGLENYQRMLNDPLVWRSLAHNVIWVIIGTASPVIIGLLLAMLLWGRIRGRLLFRTLYFMPVVLSSVVIGIIWGWIYNPIFGILNRALKAIGLDALARGWLGDPDVALYAVLVAAIWGYTGFCVVIFISGLQNVDMDLIDAATVDGANAWRRFFHVIIPQLRHVLTMVIAYTLIGGFSVFDIVWIMTKGGPANATEVIATYTYFKSFKQFDISYGAALSMLMTILALVATLIFMRIRERGQEEAA